jgi:hydrogenase/urease accessory protein HupE
MHRTALIPLLLCAQNALAHPNHPGGSPLSAGLLHLLTEPDHLAVILLPLVVVAALVTLLRRRARRAGRKVAAQRARRD